MADRPKYSPSRMKGLKYLLIAGFAAIAAGSILLVSLLAAGKTDTVLKNKVANLVSSLNVQMKLNLENYLACMETIATLAFVSEEAYTYDATAKNDEYEALSTEKEISDTLFSLCIMENFVDYGIVYRNNHAVGKLSNGTLNLFGDRLFDDLHAMITQQRTADGWCAGYADNYKRIYYVKEIHENALLVISFYNSELDHVFDNPETMDEMVIRLTDSDYETIYSSDEADLPGEPIPADIISRIQGKSAATVLDNEYLVTVSACGDEWYVICSVPTAIILKEKNEIRLYILLTAVVAAALAVLLGMVLSLKLADAVTSMVKTIDDQAHTDLLTGILNKKTFEEMTQTRLEHSLSIEHHALILLDVDNFKGVNDTLGHAYGDEVLAKIGKTLTAVFTREDFLGRIGGDEFAVFMNIAPRADDSYEELVRSKCEMLSEEFHQYYTGDRSDYKISCSMGVAIFPAHGRTFPELYAAADEALYSAKHSGKDTYAVSGEQKKGEVPES